MRDGTGDSTVKDKHLYSCISWWDLKASEVLDMGVMNEWSQLDLDMHYHNLTSKLGAAFVSDTNKSTLGQFLPYCPTAEVQ